MEEMLREYLPILVFLAVAIGLGLVLILAAIVLHERLRSIQYAGVAAAIIGLMLMTAA